MIEIQLTKNEGLVGLLDRLMDGEGGVVVLNDGVGYFRGGDKGEGGHDPIGVFLTDFRDEKGYHVGSGATPREYVGWNPCRSMCRARDQP